MRYIFVLVLFSLLIYGCTESTNPVNPVQTYSPIWPMPGYNARNTSSPYATTVVMNPVVNGALDWSFTFPSGNFSDGSQFCVDSRGFVYYLHQIGTLGALYKFTSDGKVVWKKDSLMQNNFAAISLSRDESRIYLVAYKPGINDALFCLDSAGNYKWHLPSALVTKPAIGSDGIIYSFYNNSLTAVSPDGSVLWTNALVKGSAAQNYIALDREGSIYTVNYPSTYVKVSKEGTIVWQFTSVNNFSGMVLDGYGNVYFNGYSDDKLYCLNNAGQLKWTKPNINAYFSPVITSDNRIVVSSGINLISYDTSGSEKWRCQGFTGQMSVEGLLLDNADNVYYIGDVSSGIYAGSVSFNGTKRWEVNTGLHGTLPPPVLLPGGKMLVAPKRALIIQSVN
jgi:PQQ-like domain